MNETLKTIELVASSLGFDNVICGLARFVTELEVD